MKDNIVEISAKGRRSTPLPVTDFWFAQVDARLTRIESIIQKLEWQILMLVCGTAALLLFEIIQTFSPQS
ncbi:hypothetical protein AB3Y40_06005 [Yoonia sp. R2331]|uniref:hypothetical protein n=1 Tax=Yoonia sp. R2331 TaxID=3237238 RepID=UPI0034E43512